MFTSTPRRKGESHKSKETKVFLTVKYPSQPVNKELKDNYAVISEAIINGSPQLIAQAVVKRDTLKIYCWESVTADDSASKKPTAGNA